MKQVNDAKNEIYIKELETRIRLLTNERNSSKKLSGIDLDRIGYELRNLKLELLILKDKEDIKIDSLVVGTGPVATALATQIKSTHQEIMNTKKGLDSLYKENKELPGTVYLYDPKTPGQFSRHKSMILGQRPEAQGTQAFGKDFASTVEYKQNDRGDNPLHYPVGSTFTNGLNKTQRNLNMPKAPFEVLDIEQQSGKNYPVRVKIKSMSGIEKYIETKQLYMCAGLGKARRLNSKKWNSRYNTNACKKGVAQERQISPDYEQELLNNQKLFLLNDTGDSFLNNAKKDNTIVVYGASAMSAAAVNQILETGVSNNVIWLAPDPKKLEDISTTNAINKKIFSNPEIRKKMTIGNIGKVTKGKNGQIEIELSKVDVCNGEEANKLGMTLGKDHEVILADQLLVGIGGVQPQIASKLKGFEPMYSQNGKLYPIGAVEPMSQFIKNMPNDLEMKKNYLDKNKGMHPRDLPTPVATISKKDNDGKSRIVCFGGFAQAGAGLSQEYTRGAKSHLWGKLAKNFWETLNNESQGNGSTLQQTLPQTAKAAANLIQEGAIHYNGKLEKCVYDRVMNDADYSELVCAIIIAKGNQLPVEFKSYKEACSLASKIIGLRRTSPLGINDISQLENIVPAKILQSLVEQYSLVEDTRYHLYANQNQAKYVETLQSELAEVKKLYQKRMAQFKPEKLSGKKFIEDARRHRNNELSKIRELRERNRFELQNYPITFSFKAKAEKDQKNGDRVKKLASKKMAKNHNSPTF